MSSQVAYSNSKMYFLFQFTSCLLVKLNDKGWRAFCRPSARFHPSISKRTRMQTTNTAAHTCRGGKKNTSIIPFKMASALDPLLQEIKFQNGPRFRQQNKGAWWLRVDFNNARFSTQVCRIWEMNLIISRSWKVSELNKKPEKVQSANFFSDDILYI